jgi:Chaperone of endosialidase
VPASFPVNTSYVNGDVYAAVDVNSYGDAINALYDASAVKLVTTKGDLLTGSAAATVVRTGVGSNNTVLRADSSQPGGVQWGLITSAMITDGTITGTDIASSTITGSNIASSTVTNTNLAGSIAYSKLVLTGSVTNTDLAGGIADSKLSTISTAGKVANSATTATSASTANAIVARDSDASFNAKTGYFQGGYLGGLDYTKAITAGDSGSITTNGDGVIRVGKYGLNTTAITTNQQTGSGTSYHISFYRNSGNVGSISENGSTTSFNTTSDYRLKENVVPLANALATVRQLTPKTYNFIATPDLVLDGFLAHELADVVPYAVIGEKDAVNDDGSIRPQQVDYSKLTALLVGAVQELAGRLEALETN